MSKYTASKQEREMNYHFDEVKQLKKELLKVTQERDLLKKAAAYFAKEFKLKYAWIKKHHNELSISATRKYMNLSRDGYFTNGCKTLSAIGLKRVRR